LTPAIARRIVPRMALSPLAQHRLDRVLLALTAIAVWLLFVGTTAAAGGSDQVIVRTCLLLLIVAQLVPWLTRQHAAHPDHVANLAAARPTPGPRPSESYRPRSSSTSPVSPGRSTRPQP
jgi:hypothetical protein